MDTPPPSDAAAAAMPGPGSSGGSMERKKPAAAAQEGAAATSAEKPVKRKMKTAYQLDLLEKTYAVASYPSEAVRADLSVKIGLTDRQLQMWFCHRRLKDRKANEMAAATAAVSGGSSGGAAAGGIGATSSAAGGGGGSASTSATSYHHPHPHHHQHHQQQQHHHHHHDPTPVPRKALARMSSTAAIPRMTAIEMPPPPPPQPMQMQAMRGRYYDHLPTMPPQPSVAEMRAIAFVESQLGEPIRENGPILGVEFDPLPPGAFGAPIETASHIKQQPPPPRPYETKLFDRHEPKPIKTSAFMPSVEQSFMPSSSSGGKRKGTLTSPHVVQPQPVPRTVHEYQFLPEQPSVRAEAYERHATPSHYYDPSADPIAARGVSPVQASTPYMHGHDPVSPAYPLHDHGHSAGILAQKGSQHMYSQGTPSDYEGYPPHKPLYPPTSVAAADAPPYGAQHLPGMENPFMTPDRRIYQEEDPAVRIERKRKSEEARIAKEVEAHEKRIRRELEKQDILRRKREEQMRREKERHDRERKKEEERLLRERQREEERYQRELKREHERREKFLQKENRRAEKQRLKEETRREKEAARLKAAHERATARRLAKESMELIEDERLELMELAAFCKGLPSIISLDSDTLMNLYTYKDKLCEFPPSSVKLKRPFALQPWLSSEENIGSLLMVWRFLITFSDVLSLWPFTLDEFVQSLHDYDSRLLGEIHIVLLRSIIKDIEDVARTPAIASGVNNSAANPSGGHPQIVEGAYAWGFDILSWQHHLNPLTWPEILRQFALSAGFGPHLKKRTIDKTYYQDENEGHDGENVISTLRSGMAAENALAVMQEKGFSRLRKSRHRLTPGTVKFAAFHVLSLEGPRGLTILEVADKIQKSGLRDLTTSKTPEASIAAALSRDTKLFERTAPSTYCVKAAYRKDPANAEAILAAAREKIQVFQNGLSESEEAEKEAEDVEDVERDSESESIDDPEIDADDLDEHDNISKEVAFDNEVNISNISHKLVNGKHIISDEVCTIQSDNISSIDKIHQSMPQKNLSSGVSGLKSDELVSIEIGNNSELNNTDGEDTEIDESNSGESWVQGLMEGDYSVLSVEERLNALASLVGVAIEGNSIRIVLEERLEAANALKKQMWAESQVDKRRMKEEYMNKMEFSSLSGLKSETTQANTMPSDSHSPLLAVDNKGLDVNLNSDVKDEVFDLENVNGFSTFSAERNIVGQDYSTNQDNAQPSQYGYVAEKSRSQMKLYIGYKAEEIYVYRSLPLGQDRRRNRYWQFVASASKYDPGCGRIFFESREGFWRLIDSEEVFDALIASLDTRGIRESHLHGMLQRIESSFKEASRRQNSLVDAVTFNKACKLEHAGMSNNYDSQIDSDSPSSGIYSFASDNADVSTSFRIEVGRNDLEKSSSLKRYHDFQRWLWRECIDPTVLCAIKHGKKRSSELLKACRHCFELYFLEERHCPSCHKTFKNCHNFDASFADHISRCEDRRKMDPRWSSQLPESSLPTGVRMLKTLLANVEASIPSEALQSFWTDSYRRSWGLKLHAATSLEDIFQILTVLESALKRDFLSANFETTSELLASSTSNSAIEASVDHLSPVVVLPWVPNTTAAVSLRLLDLDASIHYNLNLKSEILEFKQADDFKLPSRYDVVKNAPEFEPAGTSEPFSYQKERNWLDPSIGRGHVRGRGSRGRGRGRGRGGRGSRGGSSLVVRHEFKEEKLGTSERTARKPTKRGRGRGRGTRRGRRSVRPRKAPQSRVSIQKDMDMSGFLDVDTNTNSISRESPRSSEGDGWNLSETRREFAEEEDNSVDSSAYNDNGQASDDEYDDQATIGYAGNSGRQPGALMDDETSEEEDDDDDMDEVGDGNDDGDYGDGDGIEDEDDDGDYVNADEDINGNEDGDRGYGNGNDDGDGDYVNDESDEDDDDEDMGEDDDGLEGGGVDGDGNGGEDDTDSYSSDYSE